MGAEIKTTPDPRTPIPRGGFKTNEEDARWLEQTILLRTRQMLDLAGVSAQIAPSKLYDMLLMALDDASMRGRKEAHRG